MIRRWCIILLVLCLTAVTIEAQRVTHRFENVSMSDALRYLQSQSSQYHIVFIFNDLEDFSVTASVKNQTIPEAIRQLINFYPISMTIKGGREIYVECTHKTDYRVIGRLVNEMNEPMEYANIAILNPADSSYITGGVSNASGMFVIPVEQSQVIARISFVGYKTLYKHCRASKLGTLRMEPYITPLDEMQVSAPRASIQRNGTDLILSDLDGTMIGNAGTALEMLRWSPGILVDAEGHMTEETDWPGVFVKDADPMVLRDLEAAGKLFAAPVFEHSYPHCWRCGTPLIYYARESWFIEMTAVKDDLIRNNNMINWIPESIGKGRFGDWLENVQDWGLSRDRYWGTPLNIWECEECGHRHSIGSRAELAEMSDNWKEGTELHRPYIDEITIKCPKCGKTMHRVPEVIDCWFDSGAMPFAQHHYPFENKELFEEQFPADFISEAVDQTRGWFYSLLAISTLIFNKPCYRNCLVLGHVLDENGEKMSKSKGNAVDPFDALEEYGADAIRWYFYVNSAPWLPNRFYGDAVREGQRKFMGTLWNTYAFYVLYANIDEFNPLEYELDKASLTQMDRWVLSKLNTVVGQVDDNLANYRIPEAARALQGFVEDLSNWYVRRCRQRFWAKGMEQDKINAYMTLYTALVTIAKAAAPMIPFMTESIYQNLVRSIDETAPKSIHLCDFPVVDESMIDQELEEKMDLVLQIVTIGRACRNEANIKNRQPIGRMLVGCDEELSDDFVQIITEELNVKTLEFAEDASQFIDYEFKPQMRILGPKYGKLLGAIRQALASLDGAKAMAELKETGTLTIDAGGEQIALTEEELLISTKQMEGFVSGQDRGVTVVLDTNLTPELLEEGFVREVISKVQTMRKEAGFEVTDHIRLTCTGSDKVETIVGHNKETIGAEVLADEVLVAEPAGYTKEWKINGEEASLGVEKV